MASADEGPYVGPRPFERSAADRARFFGRDREVQEIVSLIVSHPLVLVYAQSGAGKTSLFNTAVSAALGRMNVVLLPLARIGGGSEPDLTADEIENLYVFSALRSLEPDTDRADLARLSLADYLRRRRGDERQTRVLVFDQFEELFTSELVYELYGDDWQEQQEAFFAQVSDALAGDPTLRVVFLMRKEYLAELERFATRLPERLRTRFHLEPLGADEALAAVEGPLRETQPQRSFEDGVARDLVNRLLVMRVGPERDVRGRFVEPVQLQVVCRSLWQSLPPEATTITDSDVKAFGDVDTVLGRFYEDAVRAAASAAGVREGRLRAKLEDDFITSIGTRGTVYLQDWKRLSPALGELERRHLVREEFRAGTKWYELTHDRLIDPIRTSNARRRRRMARRLALGGVLALVAALVAAFAVIGTRGESSSPLFTPPSPGANIVISSTTGTARVGVKSPLTITVNAVNGAIAAGGGTAIAQITSGPGAFVDSPSCPYRGGLSGASCTVFIRSATPGTTVVSATSRIPVAGVRLERTTVGRGGNSGPAATTWIRPEEEVRPGIEIRPRTQTLGIGETARFRVTVRNTRDVALRGVKVTDPRSPKCERLLGTMQPGSSLTYRCIRTNVIAGFTNVVTTSLAGSDTWSDSALVRCPECAVRQSILNAARAAARRHIEYSPNEKRMQGVRERIRLPNVPRYEDTSSFVTWTYWQAGARNPIGRGYDGTGNTSDLYARGRPTQHPQPGDLVFYGNADDPLAAVGVYLGNSRVVIHTSHDPTPRNLKVNFGEGFHLVGYRTYQLLR